MAPTIQVPAEHTLKALQNVLKKRTDANRVLKERQKEVLNGEGYRYMEADLNNEQFLQPVDAEDTRASIYYIRRKFTRYARQDVPAFTMRSDVANKTQIL